MDIMQRTERSMATAMCGAKIKHRKRVKDMMLVLCLNVTIDQLAIASTVCQYGDELRGKVAMI